MKFIEKAKDVCKKTAEFIASDDQPTISCDFSCKAKAFKNKNDTEPYAEGECSKTVTMPVITFVLAATAAASFIAGVICGD